MELGRAGLVPRPMPWPAASWKALSAHWPLCWERGQSEAGTSPYEAGAGGPSMPLRASTPCQ